MLGAEGVKPRKTSCERHSNSWRRNPSVRMGRHKKKKPRGVGKVQFGNERCRNIDRLLRNNRVGRRILGAKVIKAMVVPLSGWGAKCHNIGDQKEKGTFKGPCKDTSGVEEGEKK